jgi:hypothetical protein
MLILTALVAVGCGALAVPHFNWILLIFLLTAASVLVAAWRLIRSPDSRPYWGVYLVLLSLVASLDLFSVSDTVYAELFDDITYSAWVSIHGRDSLGILDRMPFGRFSCFQTSLVFVLAWLVSATAAYGLWLLIGNWTEE